MMLVSKTLCICDCIEKYKVFLSVKYSWKLNRNIICIVNVFSSVTLSSSCSSEFYTIDGNANGRVCMFPFFYNNKWYDDCTSVDTSDQRLWCAVETKYEQELWGYCPTNGEYIVEYY